MTMKITRRTAAGLGALALAAIAAAGAAGMGYGSSIRAGGSDTPRAPQAENALVVPLTAAHAGVAGAITLAPAGEDAASLSLVVEGLSPGATYQAQLRTGTPDQPGASVGRLGELVADSSGRATLTTTDVRVAAAGAAVPLSLSLLTDGERNVAVVATGSGTVASAPLPLVTMPRQTGK